MGMKSMKGERSEAFGNFTKRVENADQQLLSTYIYYFNKWLMTVVQQHHCNLFVLL